MMDISSAFGQWLSHPSPGEEVVISGISGRFPESNNVREYQENLLGKKDMVTDNDNRWKVNHPEIPSRMGKIDNLNRIDAGFFGLHYRQATMMDPALRKLLECSVEAIIDAGVNPNELKGSRTAVLVASCNSEDEQNRLSNIVQPQTLAMTGYLRSMLANRLSYYLQVKGPSYGVDTACSSSLNALHQAFIGIRTGEFDNALVGGICLVAHPFLIRRFFKLGVLSSDGIPKIFDQKADGYVKGEAVSCVFLQKFKNTKRIYAKIIHTKVLDDGYKSIGITFPSSEIQETLMTEILAESGVDFLNISYIEAHATGTAAGDPEETEAIYRALAQKRCKPLLVGSVKSNVGHCEPASGLNSLIKVLIAMETGFIAPNLHLNIIKKGMKGFEEGKMKVVTELTPLEGDDAIVSINNFGFGGNDVHLLVQRCDKRKVNGGIPEDDIPRLVCVSGRSLDAVASLLEDVKKRPLDAEYIGLLHQVFKKEITGNFYRGFTIVTKSGEIRTELKPFCNQPKHLVIIFGLLESRYKDLYSDLSQLDFFKVLLKRIEELLPIKFTTNDNIFLTLVAQLGLIEALKLLKLEATIITTDTFGNTLRDYYNGIITLKKVITAFLKFNTKDSTLQPEKKYRHSLSLNHQTQNLEDIITGFNNPLIFNLSDWELKSENVFLSNDTHMLFLELLGRLYNTGFNFHIHELYPPVNYPVSRTTPMISPLIQWDYRKSWYTYKYGSIDKNALIQEEHNLSPLIYEEHEYMKGHVINGRNLIPGIEYLNIVWKTFTPNYKMNQMFNTPVVFENCRFVKAITFPKNEGVKLLVSIQKCSGYFEVVEKDTVIVTGRIFSPKDVREHMTELPEWELSDDKTEYLEIDEIYRELYLRGYNYSGPFKGMHKCSVDGSVALVSWEDNWTTFIDKMLQLNILLMEKRLLYVQTGIDKLVINPSKHADFANQNNCLCPVISYKKFNVIKSGGVELHGLRVTSISLRKSQVSPVLEKHLFVENETKLSLDESLRVIVQVILENTLEHTFKAAEIARKNDEETVLMPLVANTLDDLPSVAKKLIVSSDRVLDLPDGIKCENENLKTGSNFLLVIGTGIFHTSSVLNEALDALSPNGFILTREDIKFVPQNNSFKIILQHEVGTCKLILLKKPQKQVDENFIKITSSNFEWLPQVQSLLKNQKNVVVYAQNSQDGILGFINCLRREPGGSRIRCLFMVDPAPEFDPQNLFFKTQIKKQLAVNIFKHNKWGTYRHLLLDNIEAVEREHVFVNNIVKGDLSSVRWVEGVLTSKTKLSDDQILVYPYYCSINFKDVMLASGRITTDSVAGNRIEHDTILGCEFSGIDASGRRVMGMSFCQGMSTMIAVPKTLLLEVPENWSLKKASSVVVVYATVIFSLIQKVKLKPRMSILIHSVTGGVGLAALNVCLYHKCEVFVTVGTQEKREYLKKHFPQIPESHIGNSRNLFYEDMVKRETKGRGVDIVLNFLSEEKLKASIRCVAFGGHFVEIGKFDLENNTSLEMLLLNKNIAFHGVMLDKMFTGPIGGVLEEVDKGIRAGYVKPLPQTLFEKDKVLEAFKYMMTGKHIGKVVLKIREESERIVNPALFKGTPWFSCLSDKTYVIIGGLGGMGLELADWLFLRNAKNLVLVSRFGVQTGYQRQKIRYWQSYGTTVQVSTQNITTKEGCANLIKEASKLAPIDGIFNLAVVLEVALFEDQTKEKFETSIKPKAQATAFLDTITREQCRNLRYFVVFSSLSCGRGNPGQTNYGMANSVMERICEKRKRDGFPALAIQWGAIGDVGLIAKMQKENKEFVIGGTLQQKISSCIQVLDQFLRQDAPVVSSMVVAEKSNVLTNLESAVNVIADILGIKDIKTVSHHIAFAELGMDSMTSTEIIQILENDFAIFVTPKEIRNLTFSKLAELEEQQDGNRTDAAKTERALGFFIRYLPSETNDDVPLVQIPSKIKTNDGGRNVLLLPGIEGNFKDLEFLTNNMMAHIFGVQYSYRNTGNSITETAKAILPYLKLKNNLCIVAYSFGAAVGVELIKLLEAKETLAQLILIDGTPKYMAAAMLKNFSTEKTDEFETSLLLKILEQILPNEDMVKLKEKFIGCINFGKRLELTLKLLPPNLAHRQLINAICVRAKALLDYKFNHGKINSPVHLFKAKTALATNLEKDYGLSEICEKNVEVSLVNGDHWTMLQKQDLLDGINKLLV